MKALINFTTAHHRFRAGDPIPADADLSPFTLADLLGSKIDADPEVAEAEVPAGPGPADVNPDAPTPVVRERVAKAKP